MPARVACVIVLLLTMTAAGARAATPRASGRSAAAVRSAHAAGSAVTGAPSGPGLLGEATVEPTVETLPAGQEEAYPFTATAAGIPSSVDVYVGAANQATSLLVGVYEDRGDDEPGWLMASGSVVSPEAGAWNQVSVSQAMSSPTNTVVAGTRYWISVLGQGGALSFRDADSASGCQSQDTRMTSLTWSEYFFRGTVAGDCTISAQVQGAPTASAAPVNTAAPAVTGSTEAGGTLSASTGTWSGSPTSYAYQWQQCASGTCTDISGATSSTYTTTASDVGDTIDVVVTAANATGDASAASAETSAVTAASSGGLPSGVTLQQIDGGVDYFSKFSNGLTTSPSYFPIAVFDQSLGYNDGTWSQAEINAYKAEGINFYVNFSNGYDSGFLNAVTAAGAQALDGPLAPSYAGNAITAYSWFDEADGDDDCGDVPTAQVLGETVSCSPTADGRTPPSVIGEVNALLHAVDPTRAVYCQYTKPVAELSGLTIAQAAAYVNAGCDIISYDSYIISDSDALNHDLWRQYDDAERVRSLDDDSKPVWAFIEAGEPFPSDQWSGVTDTGPMSVAEAWNAIIGGARGIQWFDYANGNGLGGYPTSSDTLIDSNPAFASLQSAVSAFDARVKSLAPIINDPFANGFMTSVSNPNPDSEDGRSANVMVKYDAASNDFYVFVAPTSNNAQTLTFTTAGGYSGPVTVQGESRTVTATNGTFSDTFSGQTAVHIYIVPNS